MKYRLNLKNRLSRCRHLNLKFLLFHCYLSYRLNPMNPMNRSNLNFHLNQKFRLYQLLIIHSIHLSLKFQHRSFPMYQEDPMNPILHWILMYQKFLQIQSILHRQYLHPMYHLNQDE